MKSSHLYFGRNILKEALAANVRLTKIFVETKSAYDFVQKLPGITTQKIEFEEGIPKKLKNESHQGIVFQANHSFYSDYDFDDLKKFKFIVFCNHIEDVHNLGSITRCAAAFGAGLIVHEEKQSASMTGGAIKSSAGCAFRVKFMKVKDLISLVKPLKKRGFEFVGLDASTTSTSLYEWKPNFPLVLILGSESQGIESDLKSQCDSLVHIPMKAGIESLNVSHAASIAMSHVYKA